MLPILKAFEFTSYPAKETMNDIWNAGLLTGNDIIKQLECIELGDKLILPDVLLRNGETVLLDDVDWKDLEQALATNIDIVESYDGKSFVECIIK